MTSPQGWPRRAVLPPGAAPRRAVESRLGRSAGLGGFLSSCPGGGEPEWIGRAKNLAVAGPSGTGKSHLAEAMANKAIDEGMKVSWFTLESLTAHLGRATVDNTVSKAVAKITRCDLIIIDDIGMLPSGQATAEAFYRVIDAAYERRSVIVTSNLHPSGFDSITPKTLATAAVDRLLHHAHIVLTEGSSLRLTQATSGQGSSRWLRHE
ncbi:ATP-binding protein [Streptomyces sp. NPDC058239]|uniref:ATP-binding protein n=1 Tax=unclassified Streptomyces TaxID=2593676 RepID=UPI0036682015